MKEKLKKQKGITLVALVITIIVLLILAVVSISIVMNQGIMTKSKDAADQYNQKAEEEQGELTFFERLLGQYSGKDETSGDGDGTTVETITSEKINKVLSETKNTKLKDEYGNKIVVPAGFKIKVDENTNNATHVTEGIVVTDGTNEFVWIPVGKIYTDVERREENSKTITLGRYSDFTVGASLEQTLANYSDKVEIEGFTEYTSANHDSAYKNAIAKDIKSFLESANNNGGYYLGRYEARTSTERTSSENALTTVTENKNDYVYNYVTQPQASERCQNMYNGKPFTSDLINSYAWDTAILFIQTFGGNSTYSRKTSVNQSYANKGTDTDKIRNIYDMASNCIEWSTETYSDSDGSCTFRGGSYGNSNFYTSFRRFSSTTHSLEVISFRPLLYV